eukprot:gnl/TRDRNA2_/TRDRNA2_60964_c1_seq1.p1 gnl/TRDRNA2_/TRDRNA2_60964_c1~~gnl/TRDRNA2_/TRDRNA2_60964_c1_seq1.p1  ORF type:complete len:331 (+),score=57.30 gnl/TRDRNA2_/TRDRNA2_60964_c1_seq1:93-995(+)
MHLSALLMMLSEVYVVHVDLFQAAAQLITSHTHEMRPLDMLRLLRSFTKCNQRHEPVCQAIGTEVVNRVGQHLAKHRGGAAPLSASGFRVEDLVEIAWMLCVLQSYHEGLLRLMFQQLKLCPKVKTESLCQLYEVHLVLETEHKDAYATYCMEPDIVQSLLDHYKEHRKLAGQCTEKQRDDVAATVKSLVDGPVRINHRTSTGLLVHVAALRKRSSVDGFIHVELDTPATVITALDQDDASVGAGIIEGSVALRRRILQRHGLQLVTVKEKDWGGLEEKKEKKRHIRSLLSSLESSITSS